MPKGRTLSYRISQACTSNSVHEYWNLGSGDEYPAPSASGSEVLVLQPSGTRFISSLWTSLQVHTNVSLGRTVGVILYWCYIKLLDSPRTQTSNWSAAADGGLSSRFWRGVFWEAKFWGGHFWVKNYSSIFGHFGRFWPNFAKKSKIFAKIFSKFSKKNQILTNF